ncbi:hypothetical protein K438DRAFT_1847403, partial [Mycena galopus ATCC 62051]
RTRRRRRKDGALVPSMVRQDRRDRSSRPHDGGDSGPCRKRCGGEIKGSAPSFPKYKLLAFYLEGSGSDALIWVVDGCDRGRLEESGRELKLRKYLTLLLIVHPAPQINGWA